MNKHTPGPWSFRKAKGKVLACIEMCGKLLVLKSKISDADANLITAAPDLLEALEKLLADFESAIHNEYDGTHVLNGILAEVDYARAAISRARGEA